MKLRCLISIVLKITSLYCTFRDTAFRTLCLCQGYLRRWLYWLFPLLPPANEVWGKVIFSQMCVIPSVHRTERGLYPEGCLHLGVSASRGVCMQGHGSADPPSTFGYYRIRSTSGRYASYWSAFLVLKLILHTSGLIPESKLNHKIRLSNYHM